MSNDYQKALALLQAATKLMQPQSEMQTLQNYTALPNQQTNPAAAPPTAPQVAPSVVSPMQPAGPSPAIPAIPQLQGLPPSAPQATATLTLDQLASMTPAQINQNWSQVQALMDANQTIQ